LAAIWRQRPGGTRPEGERLGNVDPEEPADDIASGPATARAPRLLAEEPMPERLGQLHAPDEGTAPVVLLLIDMINDLEFEEGARLLTHALPAARRTADLKRRARDAGMPVIYVNDNFGRWRSDFNRLVDHCLKGDVRGRPIAELLLPDEDDYFVLKPKHSGFFSTTLDALLRHLAARTLILTGIAGNICVLCTAGDAHMRGYQVIVPSDCTASNTPDVNRQALEQMRDVFDADIRPSTELDPSALLRAAR
jgi:nicotinamidase-related amidase